MSILRAAALVAVVVFCGGFIPVGGCAKGCGRVGRVASHEADDIARLGTRTGLHTGESVAVGGAHYADDLARTSGRYGDDLAHTGAAYGDDLARTAEDIHAPSLADEVEHSGIRLSEADHDEVVDALKDVGEEVLGQLADGDDSDDEADLGRTAVRLETRLKATLSREQLREFHAQFGDSRHIVERITREQAAKQSGGSGKK